MAGRRNPKGPSGWYSIVPTVAAEVSSITRGALRTLILLGSYANPARWAWPSQATLAERLSTDRRTLRKWLAELEDLGLIRRWPFMRPNGGKGSDWILVAPFPDGVTGPPSGHRNGAAEVHEFAPGGGGPTAPWDGGYVTPGDGVTGPPRTVLENSPENSPMNVRQNNAATSRGEGEASDEEKPGEWHFPGDPKCQCSRCRYDAETKRLALSVARGLK